MRDNSYIDVNFLGRISNEVTFTSEVYPKYQNSINDLTFSLVRESQCIPIDRISRSRDKLICSFAFCSITYLHLSQIVNVKRKEGQIKFIVYLVQ